jgi:hypothetical protein
MWAKGINYYWGTKGIFRKMIPTILNTIAVIFIRGSMIAVHWWKKLRRNIWVIRLNTR